MKKILVAFLVLIGLFYAPLSVESYEVSPEKMIPGQTGSIIITLKNVQPTGITTITKSVEDVSIYHSTAQGVQFLVESPIQIGTIEGGSTALAVIPIRITENASGGIVSPSFSIQQRDGSKQVLTVPIKVTNAAIITVSFDTQTFTGTDTLHMTITNKGGRARKMTIKINNTDDFALIGQDQVFVGDVSESKTVELGIDSTNAPSGVVALILSISYQDENGDTITEEKKIAVTVKKENADVVFTQASAVTTSKDSILELRMENTGKSLEDFRITFEDERVQTKEANEIKVGVLGANEERVVSIPVFIEAQPGVRNINVTLTWIENDVEKEEKTSIPIVVSSDADVAIFLEAKPAPLAIGAEHTLSVLVSNTGSYKIENVEVALTDADVFEILNAQPAQYIGGLESDDFSTVQYKVKIRNVEPGTYAIPVLVKYKDQSGTMVEKTIANTISIRQGEGQGGLGIIPIIAVLAIALVGYWWYRKSKKQAQRQ